MENKTKEGYQAGNKAMKTKITNMLWGKERKKEIIDMQSYIEIDEEDLCILKIKARGKEQ